MTNTDGTSPAGKTDIGELKARLDQHDDQFTIILRILGEIQDDTQTIRRDLRALADKLLDNHERRLVACERRLGLAN